jgi:hypothetical protein
MSNIFRNIHDIKILPIFHPVGYRQILFQDTLNIFNKGHNALFVHNSPHK